MSTNIKWIVENNGLTELMLEKGFYHNVHGFLEANKRSTKYFAYIGSEAVRKIKNYGFRLPNTKCWFVIIPNYEKQIEIDDLTGESQIIIMDGKGEAMLVEDGDTLMKMVYSNNQELMKSRENNSNNHHDKCDYCHWCRDYHYIHQTYSEINEKHLVLALLAFKITINAVVRDDGIVNSLCLHNIYNIIQENPVWKQIYDHPDEYYKEKLQKEAELLRNKNKSKNNYKSKTGIKTSVAGEKKIIITTSFV